jgi:hypothetical protein
MGSQTAFVPRCASVASVERLATLRELTEVVVELFVAAPLYARFADLTRRIDWS